MLLQILCPLPEDLSGTTYPVVLLQLSDPLVEGEIHSAHILPEEEDAVDPVLNCDPSTLGQNCKPGDLGPVPLSDRCLHAKVWVLLQARAPFHLLLQRVEEAPHGMGASERLLPSLGVLPENLLKVIPQSIRTAGVHRCLPPVKPL